MILQVLFSFLTALLITSLAIPSIIRVSYLKHLYDVPDDRKSHTKSIPTLGGLAIFAGFTIALFLFVPEKAPFLELKFIMVALLIIFFIGIKDDILIIAPLKKLFGQFLAVAIIVILGKVQLTSMYGLFGIFDIPNYIGIPLTIFTLLVIMNGFNLIDGINWLSGGIGALVALSFGTWFFINGFIFQAIIASSLFGALLGFMWFNKTPAKIFMGDTGSLILGLLNGVLCIYFIEHNSNATVISFNSVPILAFGILIVPLFDTLRVFTWRVLNGKSPFHPDKNHVHHRLLDNGFSHIQSSLIIMAANFLIIIVSYFLINIGSLPLLIVQLVMASFLSYLPSYMIKKRTASQKGKVNRYNFKKEL